MNWFYIFQSLWVERTTLILVQSLPGISRWFEVEKREVVSTRLMSIHIVGWFSSLIICYLMNCFRIYYTYVISLTKVSGWLQQNDLQSMLSCPISLVLKSIIKNHPQDSFEQLRKKKLRTIMGTQRQHLMLVNYLLKTQHHGSFNTRIYIA